MNLYGVEALIKCIDLPNTYSAIDVGAGAQNHAKILNKHGIETTTVDSNELKKADYLTIYDNRLNNAVFDLVWCCHTLEHIPNVDFFLQRLKGLCVHGGHIAITVPPLKHEIVGGHVSLWNGGLLLYRLALAGVDCREAMLKQYDYNISVIVKYNGPNVELEHDLTKLVNDSGDINRLSPYLPIGFTEHYNGNIDNLNWS